MQLNGFKIRMKIKAIFFAGVREALGKGELQLELPMYATVADAWDRAGGVRLRQKVLCAVNEHYTDLTHVLKEGDVVAFFPPVTGG